MGVNIADEIATNQMNQARKYKKILDVLAQT